MLKPTDCIAKDFTTKWYKKWTKAVNLPAARHPKFWEMAAIAEALDARKCLRPGKTGLGMGVGNEQLVSLFAARGASVVATDQNPEAQNAQKWNNGQLAHGSASLFYPDIVTSQQFAQNVRYEPYDMNTYNPAFAGKFDFVWHNCVIGHLGSLAKSVAQLKHSAEYLRPGGWLVLTTELNISSLTETISEGSDTVIWRLADLETLFTDMAANGMVAERFTLRLGDWPEDRRINFNYNFGMYERQFSQAINDPENCEIKIPFGGYAITQILLCFQKTSKQPRHLVEKFTRDTQKNEQVLMRHVRNNTDLREYFTPIDTIQYTDAQLMPERKQISLTMEAGSTKRLNLRFLNRSELRLFDFSLNTPFNRPPLVVATFDEVNRESDFATDAWPSSNRPSLTFMQQKAGTTSFWNAHRIESGEWFEYSFPITAPRQPGDYTESFVLVFEGVAVALSSVVEVNITVTPRLISPPPPPHAEGTVTEFFHKIGWEVTKLHAGVPEQFTQWLKLLAQRKFVARQCINAYEFLSFLTTYLQTHHPNLVVSSKIKARIVDHQTDAIIINDSALVPSLRTRLIILASTPRVGGTVFSHLLSELTGWPYYAVSSMDMLDVNSLSGPTIVHIHLPRDVYLEHPLEVPHQVITLARNPLDTLISAFMFAQHNPSTAYWLDGAVFPKPVSFTSKEPDSPEFFAWAKSKEAIRLLSVTPSWWDHAEARVKYENFKQNSVQSIAEVLTVIDPGREYQEYQIQQAVDTAEQNFLADATNKHRWNGGSNYAETLLPTKEIEALQNVHREVITKLGYD